MFAFFSFTNTNALHITQTCPSYFFNADVKENRENLFIILKTYFS